MTDIWEAIEDLQADLAAFFAFVEMGGGQMGEDVPQADLPIIVEPKAVVVNTRGQLRENAVEHKGLLVPSWVGQR